jgi:hypothetical protein
MPRGNFTRELHKSLSTKEGCLARALCVGQRIEHVVAIFGWDIKPEVSVNPMLECLCVNESCAIEDGAH